MSIRFINETQFWNKFRAYLKMKLWISCKRSVPLKWKMHAFNSSKNVKKAKQHKDNTWKEITANNIRFMDHATVVHCQGFFLFSNNVPHDFTAKFEVYCHKLHEDLTIASTPKKLRKKINDLSGSVGRSVGKRLSGLVRYQILYSC